MSDRVVITKVKDVIISALIRDNKVFDILGRKASEDQGYKTGDIVKAKVKTVQPNISAAFLDLTPGVRAFMETGGKEIKPESEITVQIVKEAFGEKDMVVSPAYSVSGKYLVLTNGRHGVGISRKIEGDRRKDLIKLLSGMTGTIADAGVVIRTNAENASDDEIEEEFNKLYDEINEIRRKDSISVPYIRLRSALSPESAFVRDLREEPEEVVTDLPEIYEVLKEDLKTDEIIYNKIRLYSDDFPLIKLYPIESSIDQVFNRVVHLHSGGNIVIDRTEACHVIDVNSGKNTDRISRSDLIIKTNTEAVKEAARQIRIRNLSGMILIDLINMNNEKEQNTVIDTLKAELKKDRLRCEFIDITGLGIAELAREKKRVPLREVFNDRLC